MHGRPAHENAQVKGITARPPKQTDPPGEGKRQQGQKKKKGQDPLLRWREGYKQSPHQKLRPKDDDTHPEDGPEKNVPMSPTLGIPSLEIIS